LAAYFKALKKEIAGDNINIKGCGMFSGNNSDPAIEVEKMGNISGEVNSKLDEIIGQIEDAFKIPYFNLNPKSPIYIFTLPA